MKIEIERKFLLKNVPKIEFNNKLLITQFYKPDKLRLRIVSEYNNETLKATYWKNLKKRISNISAEEIDETITHEEFIKLSKGSTHVVNKIRFIKEIGELKWEIDKFSDICLIVAEIEIPFEDYKLEIPDFIKDNLIMEVSEFREFSNRKLAKRI